MYSAEELEQLWYTESECIDIKRRAVETVKMMMKGKKRSGGFIETDDHTARGLECRIQEAAIERKEFKAFARDLVLEEQEDQNDQGIKSSSRLRKVHLKASSVSSKKAVEYGRKDAEAVNENCLQEVLKVIKLEHGGS